MFSLRRIYQNLITPEQSGKKIGLFRGLCAIFGGLVVAYLGMTFITSIIPDKVENAIMIPLLFNTLAWACMALWISVSHTKMQALLRVFVPSIVFSYLIYISY